MKNWIFVFLFCLFHIDCIFSQVPRLISYQGVLTDNQGNILPDGNRSLTIRIYDQLGSTNPIFTETQNVMISKGIFNLNIGSVNPISNSILFDRPYYLGVSIDFGAELSPRTVFTATPYSLRSERSTVAESLAPGALGVVTSVNSSQGNINIVGGGGTTVNTQGNVITISSSGGGGQGIAGIQNSDGILNISNPNGPTASVNLNTAGVSEENSLVYRNSRWQVAQVNSFNFNPDIFSKTQATQPFLGIYNIDLKTSGVSENFIPKFRNGKWQFLPPLEISQGPGIIISSVTPGPDKITISAVDDSPNNEIQTLGFDQATKVLSLSRNGGTVNLSSLSGGSSPWSLSSNNIFNTNLSTLVGIGTNSPSGKLHVADGSVVLSNGGQRFNITPRSNGQIAFEANGAAGDNTMVIDDGADRSVNIGTDQVTAGFKLKVVGKALFQNGVFFGNTEGFTDGGSNSIVSNATIRPDITSQRDLGTTALKFRELFLAGGVNFGSGQFLRGSSNALASNSSLIPSLSGTVDLGSSTQRWNTLFTNTIELGTGSTIRRNASGQVEFENSLVPASDGIRNIGAASKNWNNIFLSGAINFSNSASITTSNAPHGIVSSTHILPGQQSILDLGQSNAQYRWRNIYLLNPPNVSSDIRLKENIARLNYGLEDILKLNPKRYILLNDQSREVKFGFIAQDVLEIIPELISGDGEVEMLGMSYTELIPILVNAIKEQQKEIEDLKEKLHSTKALSADEINQLRSLLPVASKK